MNILISIGTFIAGFFANKALEWATALVSKKLRERKKQHNFDNFYTSLHEDILITASGFPCFTPENIKGRIDKEKVLLLSAPVGEEARDTEECAVFSPTDRMPDAFAKYVRENSLSTQLERIRASVYQSFCEKKNGNYFNGKTLGISRINGFERTADHRELPVLNIEFFETDYYTHKIIGKLLENSSFDNSVIPVDTEGNFSWARNSFGISLILIFPKEDMLLLTKRSRKAAFAEDKEWIYVSVTEAVSETDLDEESGKPDISKAVIRGINEELGIVGTKLRMDTLCFYETFYETHFHQDNIVASIEVSDTVNLSEVGKLMSKDKFMEINGFLSVPKKRKAIAEFIEKNREEMRAQTIFSLESFIARLEE